MTITTREELEHLAQLVWAAIAVGERLDDVMLSMVGLDRLSTPATHGLAMFDPNKSDRDRMLVNRGWAMPVVSQSQSSKARHLATEFSKRLAELPPAVSLPAVGEFEIKSDTTQDRQDTWAARIPMEGKRRMRYLAATDVLNEVRDALTDVIRVRMRIDMARLRLTPH